MVSEISPQQEFQDNYADIVSAFVRYRVSQWSSVEKSLHWTQGAMLRA